MVETVTETDLRPRQMAAIAVLLTSGKIAEAAAAGGVTSKTIYAWLRQEAFSAALRAAEADAMRALARRLAGLGELAADAIADALDPKQPIGIRLRAADLVCSRGPAIIDLVDVQTRLAALEAKP
jgi:hypothetical protein